MTIFIKFGFIILIWELSPCLFFNNFLLSDLNRFCLYFFIPMFFDVLPIT